MTKLEELDEYLSEIVDEGWYEFGYDRAQDILDNFTDEDWETIFEVINDKTDVWKENFAYVLHEGYKMNGLKAVLLLLNSTDSDVIHTSISNLKYYHERYGELILSDKNIVEQIDRLLKEGTPQVKKSINYFLGKM